ncbi:melanoma cell adhesion molecule b isoform X2 [Anoplopoma fimbria]|uniref:melanoma cell adhesion molecule b isoform X2 n=1 Tax=Anoplopoma fimbria TaxID=229290 RepID=UPI0023EC3EFE|nr:melanoma cell adhesion molecule b isoform X2 [Anoplopoma fimbria]
MAARNYASLLVGLLALCHTWGVMADVEVNMEDRVEVFRGETALITCMFTSSEGIGGMSIQWFYVTLSGERQSIFYQDSAMKNKDKGTPFTDRFSVNGTGADGEIVLRISDVKVKDETEFICLIKSLTEGSGEGRTKLKVFATPDPPSIEVVETGISINENSPSKVGTCEVKNCFPKPNITWYRNNTPLRGAPDVVKVVPSVTVESSGLYSVKSDLSMKVKKEDKNDTFYCEVTFFVPGGTSMTETNHMKINVHYPSTAVKVWVESPKGHIKEGDSIEFHCHGNGNMPSSVLSIVYNGDDYSLDDNVFVLDKVTRRNSGIYQCTSTDFESDHVEEVSGNTTVFVNYLDPAVVTPTDTVVVDQGKELKATCNALSSLQTQVVWMKNGTKFSTGHSLILKDATFDSAGKYVCMVTVPEIVGMETSGTLDVKVQGPPDIKEPGYTEMEESTGSTVDLRCNVRGFPAPTITWTTSDGKILKTEVGLQSVVSIKVTSDITASCNASNEFGTDVATFNINAIKAQTETRAKEIKKEGNGVIIAVLIICILLLAILGSVLYFLYKKGKICGRSGKQDLTKEKSSKDNIVVEMKSDNTEEAVLLGVNGEKQHPSNQ